ncbi:MAG: AzlC family ABC transporter permease [Chloroflexota bacterium]
MIATSKGAPSGVLRGARDSISLLLGFLPLGMAFGIAAREYGFSALEASLMSLLVYAGASQFIAIALIAGGAGVLEVAVTTFFVNLRHALMSASLAVYLRDAPRRLLSLLAFHLTDETFGLSVTRFARGEADRWYLLGANLVTYTTWNVGTLAGHAAGELLPPLVRDSMAFALPAVFLSLLVMSCRDRITVAVAVFSSALSVALYLGQISFGNVILVGLAGATLGMVLERWKGR